MIEFLSGGWFRVVGLSTIQKESLEEARKNFANFTTLIQLKVCQVDGFGWREVFFFGAAVGCVSTVPLFLFIRTKPRGGEKDRSGGSSKHVKESEGGEGKRGLLMKLLKKPAFILVCLLSFMLRSVRSFFMTFTVGARK